MGLPASIESVSARAVVALAPPLVAAGLRALGCDLVAATGFPAQLSIIAARAAATTVVAYTDGLDRDGLLQALHAVRETLPGSELIVLLPAEFHASLVADLSALRAVVAAHDVDTMSLQFLLGVGIAAPQLLTRREVDVLVWAAQGLSNQMIARRMGLQLNTVKNYLRSVHRKLGARSRTEAVMIAARAGYSIIPVP